MKNSLKDAGAESHRIVGSIIEDIRVCMLTTAKTSGELTSRPMQVMEVDGAGSLWFFTSTNATVIDEVRANSHLHVTFADAGKNMYLSAQANAFEVHDRAKMEELWNPALKAWFKDGLDTPDIVLLKVDMQDVEYWEAPHSAVVRVAGFVKALVSDAPYNPGRHEKVDLRH